MRLVTMRRPTAMLKPSCPSRRKTNLNFDPFFKVLILNNLGEGLCKPAVSRQLQKKCTNIVELPICMAFVLLWYKESTHFFKI